MAIEVYGVTSGVVIKSMGGIDRNSISATTDPSTDDVDEWIQDGAGIVGSAIAALNISDADVKDQRVFKAAIRAYAAYRLYEHFNRPEAAQRSLDEHESHMKRIGDMGTLEGYDAAQLYATNIRTIDPHKKKWEKRSKTNDGQGGFDGW